MKGNANQIKCPFCSGPVETGSLLGNINFPYVQDGFQWFGGEPTVWKNLMELGDPIGKVESLKGAYVTGFRCNKCRKIVLSY